MRIESRKGILSRKSSVNKNSFYKQKSKEFLPNKLFQPSSGIGGMGSIQGGGGRSPASVFTKNGAPTSAVGSALPALSKPVGSSVPSSGGLGGLGSYTNNYGKGVAQNITKPPGLQQFSGYNYGGVSGGIGGGFGTDPYNNIYQENSQGAQGSIGSSGNGMKPGGNPASRGADFKLPTVPLQNKNVRGMPSSKGLESRDANSNAGKNSVGAYKSNLGAGYNKPVSTLMNSGLNAFNVPKYGSQSLGGGIGGGIGLGGGLFGGPSFPSNPGLGGGGLGINNGSGIAGQFGQQ